MVEHVKQWGLDADTKSAIEAQFDYPFMQLPEKLMPLAKDAVAVVLRSEGDPTAVIGSVRRAVEEIDPREVVYNVQTMDEVVSNSFAARRLAMILLGVFASLALMLACVGIYGVISYLTGHDPSLQKTRLQRVGHPKSSCCCKGAAPAGIPPP